MEESFAAGLLQEELKPLLARRDGPGLAHLVVQVGALALATVGIAVAPDPITLAIAVVAHGVAQTGFFPMLHESLHRTAFATPWLNTLGTWLGGVTQLSGPAAYRDFHFTHHRHTHEVARDPELAGMAMMALWPSGALALVNLTGLPLLAARLFGLVAFALGPPAALPDQVFPYVKDRKRVAWESRGLVLLYVAASAAAWAWMPQLLWIWASVAVAHALLSVYLTCEHRGLAEGGSILDRTRTFEADPITRWWMWNMPYHAEHHGWPGVPFHALPALHARIASSLPHRGRGILALHLRGGAD
jgi:fatty acid desaturase